MYNLRGSTLDQIIHHDRFIKIDQQLSNHCSKTGPMTTTDFQQLIEELIEIAQKCPIKKSDCERLVQKCNKLIANTERINQNQTNCDSKTDDNRSNVEHLTPSGSQSIFSDCDHQWLQSMIDSFLADESNSVQWAEENHQWNMTVSQRSQQLLANQTIQCSQEREISTQNSVPTLTNEPNIPSQTPKSLVVLSLNDISRLANILQLSPETLTIAIEMLNPKYAIQAVNVEFMNNENQLGLASSSQGSAISATPPSQMRRWGRDDPQN